MDFLATHPEARDITNTEGYTPIIMAVKVHNIEIVPLLLDGSRILFKDREGKTVLHHAVIAVELETESFLQMITQIVEHAKKMHPHEDFVNFLDSSSASPLYYCAERGKVKTAKVLIELGAWINTPKDARGKDVFIKAAKSGRVTMVELFLSKKANFDLENLKKDIPTKMVKYLVEYKKLKNL